ncbi:MAG: hypothetical protein ACFFCM_11880 [Promethearchaeota archaeon]
MSEASQKEVMKKITELFQQAREDERQYNWKDAIKILQEIEKISIEKKLRDIEAKVHYKLGEIYQFAADFEPKKENVLKNFKLSISSFQSAFKIFKELKNEGMCNASFGHFNLLIYISGIEEGNEEFLLDSAKKSLNAAKQLFLKKGNFENSLKMSILESRTLDLIVGEKSSRVDENADFMKLISEFEELTTKIWDELNHFDIPEIYHYHFLASIVEFIIWGGFCLPLEDFIKGSYTFDTLNKLKKIITEYEKSTKYVSYFSANTIFLVFNMTIGTFIVDDQFEQKKYFKVAKKWLKKGELLIPRIAKPSRILFYFVRYTNALMLINLGYFVSDFKRVMENLDLMINLVPLHFPRITAITDFFYSASIFLVSALNSAVPDIQRINFAKKALQLNEFITNQISILNNPVYKMYSFEKSYFLCTAHAILGNLIEDKQEKSSHLQIASKIFNEMLIKVNPRIKKAYAYLFYLILITRVGILLARNSSNISEKVDYYRKTIDILLEGIERKVPFLHIENLFLLGDLYNEMGKLTNDDNLFKNSYLAYMNAIEYCKDKGYFNLIGSGYVNLAKIEDRLGNFLSAADNYKKAIQSFDQAILTLTYSKLGNKIEKLKNYLQAWNLIEIAKSFHVNEEHQKAQSNYDEASSILNNIREYNYEAPFYSAWAILEKAEYLSKGNKHEEAAATYLVSKNSFQEAIEVLNSCIGKRKYLENMDRISQLIEVANIRVTYCTARYQIETARLESKKGNHLPAAELYKKSGLLFENLCQRFTIKREKDELTAIFYLCEAWENMERADLEQKPEIYATAAKLFEKAGNIFSESRMKKLSIGNSLYCSAIEYGNLFDKSTEIKEKIEYYKKIKMFLRESSKNYQLGGFKQDAQWALATSTFFDGIWHLIQADNEIDFSKKDNYLDIATKYLRNALNIFEQAKYKQKSKEVQNYLEMIRDERDILASALSIIDKPEISASAIGISAPTCPAEVSSSINIEEMQRTDLTTESEMNWQKCIHHIYLFVPSGICLATHSFKLKEEIEPHLVAGGLTGISALIQEVTKSETKIKRVEQEEITILLEHGKYLTAALITEEDLITLQNKLVKLIQDVENFYQEELENFSGNLSVFSKIEKFIQKTFEN